MKFSAGRIVNISRQQLIFNHWVYLSHQHDTSRKRLRDTLIPVPGKRLHFKNECWFWALCLFTRKDENWQKWSLLGVYIWRIYQLPMNLCESHFNWGNIKLQLYEISVIHILAHVELLDHSLLSLQKNLHILLPRTVLDDIWTCTWALHPHSVATILQRSTRWWK